MLAISACRAGWPVTIPDLSIHLKAGACFVIIRARAKQKRDRSHLKFEQCPVRIQESKRDVSIFWGEKEGQTETRSGEAQQPRASQIGSNGFEKHTLLSTEDAAMVVLTMGKERVNVDFDLNPTLPGVPDPYPIYRTMRKTDPVEYPCLLAE